MNPSGNAAILPPPAQPLLLMLDYDGTLVPIRKRPGEALLASRARKILAELSRKPGIVLAVVSGRILADVRRKVGLPGVIYAGNHGFEVEGPGMPYRSWANARFRKLLDRIRPRLAALAEQFSGAFIEDKRIIISLHYRLVDRKRVPALLAAFRRIVLPYRQKGEIRLARGKKVVEVRAPVTWNKGTLVLWLYDREEKLRPGIVPLYIGDDLTDEDAFVALSGRGITFHIGVRRRTHARYCLPDQPSVIRFLAALVRRDRAPVFFSSGMIQ